METQVSQVLLGTGVRQERPTPFQALQEPQDKKESKEFQVRPDTSNITICTTRTQYVVGRPGWDRYKVLLVSPPVCPLSGVRKEFLRDGGEIQPERNRQR